MKITPSNSLAAAALISISDAKGLGSGSGQTPWSLGRNVNAIAGLVKKHQRRRPRLLSVGKRNRCGFGGLKGSSNNDSKNNHYPTSARSESTPLFNDEICDCFENDYNSPSATTRTRTEFAKSTAIVERDSPKKSISDSVQYMIRGCYFSCPGEAYQNFNTCPQQDDGDDKLRGLDLDLTSNNKSSDPIHDHRGEAILISLRNLKERVENAVPKIPTGTRTRTRTVKPKRDVSESGSEEISTLTTEPEPSPAILSGIIQPLIPKNIWNSLTGKEFYFPSVLSGLIDTGIETAMPKSSEFIDWSPADSKTKKLMEANDNQAIRNALEDDDVLVWIGKFKEEGHGSDLPLVRTTSILPLSPKDMASLLMDSKKVPTYNKMSLGRNDEVVFQEGIDTSAEGPGRGAMMIDGEAKIVRNLTKPPLSKKLMEFVTVMYARRLKAEDNVGVGIMGGNHEDGYAVISRAVSGGRWGGNSEDGEESERTRSEILLGMNLIRTVPGDINKSEVTAVTHCNSPSVPKMLAKSVGVKGAVDFVRDIRAMFNEAA